MSKVKNKTKKTKAKITTTNNTVVTDGDVSWDELKEVRDETASMVMGQQQMLTTLVVENNDKLDKSEDTKRIIHGAFKTIGDIANDIRETSLLHATKTTKIKTPAGGEIEAPKEYKVGKINQDDTDNYLKYIEITTGYITAQEKLSSIMSTAYVDIFTELKVPTAELSAMIKEQQDSIKEPLKKMKGSTNGSK